jgi:hypothetical protein
MESILRGRTTLPDPRTSTRCTQRNEQEYLIDGIALAVAERSQALGSRPMIRQGYIHQALGPLQGLRAMATIGDQLQSYRLALTEAQAKGESAIASKIEQQIKELEDFQQRHPEEAEAPSPFEVFCDLNPSDINCRVYDD